MEAVIGLEIHVQMTSLKTKLFCSCPADYRGAPPNTHVCPVCLGLPGALPVVNREAVRKAVMLALALNCRRIAGKVVFSRKHYFYPDLPKNYQITQFKGGGGAPIAEDGYLELEMGGGVRRVRIRRINMEEDPGRLVYTEGDITSSPEVLVDYNRSGIALLEIVTEPDLSSPGEARVFLEKLRAIIEYLGIADLSLEGAMRVDANISLPRGARVEVKNIGSVREVEKALSYEVVRQKALLSRGAPVGRETRHWDPVRGVTRPLRVKEEEEDYRYFPDPDLPPIPLPQELVDAAAALLPELPDARMRRFVEEHGLRREIAYALAMDKRLADFYEETLKHYWAPRLTAVMLAVDYLSFLEKNRLRMGEDKLTPELLAKLVRLVGENVITPEQGKHLLFRVAREGVDPEEVVEKEGLRALRSEEELRGIVIRVVEANPKAVSDAARNPKAVNFLVGRVMRETQGRAEPRLVRRLVVEELRRRGVRIEA